MINYLYTELTSLGGKNKGNNLAERFDDVDVTLRTANGNVLTTAEYREEEIKKIWTELKEQKSKLDEILGIAAVQVPEEGVEPRLHRDQKPAERIVAGLIAHRVGCGQRIHHARGHTLRGSGRLHEFRIAPTTFTPHAAAGARVLARLRGRS